MLLAVTDAEIVTVVICGLLALGLISLHRKVDKILANQNGGDAPDTPDSE
jgi:hypothetical protein